MCAKTSGTLEGLAVVGIDIGKDTFHLAGFDRSGQVVLRKQIKRLALSATFEKLPRCMVGMEACLSAHFVSRTLRGMGLDPRIIPAIYVKPFAKGQKNDYNDAEAIAEAAMRPNLRTVAEKSQDQLDLQALHRVRARLVSRRTATINQIRAFLIEQGIAVRSGLRALRNSFETILEQRREEISPRMRSILIGLYGDWLWLDDRIAGVSKEIEEISRTEENCANIMSIPGIGPVISTAMVAAVGQGEAFDRGRDFAAWVGLVPRQFSTGGRTILGRITKRGSRYLRMLFVQAAKVIMMRPHRWEAFSFGAWLQRTVARMPRNKAAMALANKLARTAWSILRHGTRFNYVIAEPRTDTDMFDHFLYFAGEEFDARKNELREVWHALCAQKGALETYQLDDEVLPYLECWWRGLRTNWGDGVLPGSFIRRTGFSVLSYLVVLQFLLGKANRPIDLETAELATKYAEYHLECTLIMMREYGSEGRSQVEKVARVRESLLGNGLAQVTVRDVQRRLSKKQSKELTRDRIAQILGALDRVETSSDFSDGILSEVKSPEEIRQWKAEFLAQQYDAAQAQDRKQENWRNRKRLQRLLKAYRDRGEALHLEAQDADDTFNVVPLAVSPGGKRKKAS